MTAHKIIWTKIDEAPALATYGLLPVVQAYANICEVDIETKDISLAGRIIANFPDLGAGEHLFTWSGYDVYGHPLATGVYFAIIEVTSGTQVEINKLKIAILNR